MQLATYAMDRTEARERLMEYRRALKSRARTLTDAYQRAKPDERTRQAHAVSSVYFQLSRGRAVVDVLESFKLAGVDERGEPKLAICHADAKFCFLEKGPDGAAHFWGTQADDRFARRHRLVDIRIPPGSFSWPAHIGHYTVKGETTAYRTITRPHVRTVAPMIPPQHMPAPSLLPQLFLLWEPTTWEPVPPRDPLLLRRLTSNLFVVLAQWDLTPIEQAVMRGALIAR